MEYRMKLVVGTLCAVLLAGIAAQAPVFAKSTTASVDKDGKQRYIVLLQDPPLAAYDGRILMTPEWDADFAQLPATANSFTGNGKLDVMSPRSRQYLKFLDQRFEHFRGTAALKLGRQLNTVHRYRNAVNGFAADLEAGEVQAVRNLQGVEDVFLDQVHRIHTDSGPDWIGADDVHIGNAGFNPTGGEGVVIGIIDSGVNWDHASFFDQIDWDHENPYGSELGLCADEEVKCNDKLVGVYDFVEDDPATEETEENNNGLDNTGHGSHVASIAGGNPRTVTYQGNLLHLAGVAPNANIISYRVCYLGDSDGPGGGGCLGTAILSAIDQAISDQVDVINYSVGTDASDPWRAATSMAFLNARAAGIFVATSAGNEGPNAGSIGSPANAPWLTAVGAATHDRVFGNLVSQMSGGDTTPPVELLGASLTDGLSVTKIVHAKDFGSALCGVGASESGSVCDDYTGASNPFPANTFNGEIVVCDRGGYDFIEKSKNLMLAGAGGYIVANIEQGDEAVFAHDHCLPATHIGETAGDQLRTWLDSGSGHQASISNSGVLHRDELADEISFFSSRGPSLPPVEDILKPDVIAPGYFILAAFVPDGGSYAFLDGTSQSSPHVAGGAALIKGVHPDWTPAMIASSLAMTATPELAHDFNGSDATPHKRGSGRPRLDLAVGAALYVNETENGFLAANPSEGGDPKDLNLPGMVDTVCRDGCSFNRTVTDLVGGASWSVAAEGFAEGVSVNVSPQNFTLADGASRLLSVDIDLTGALVVGTWVYGEIRLSSSGHPDAVFTVAVFADGGPIPSEWTIDSKEISGWQEFGLSGLTAMPDATLISGGLVIPTLTIEDLPQDPTPDSPYDDSAGLMTLMLEVPPDTLWLHTSTLESTATDLDLFVGLDANNNGIAEPNEELCTSTSPTEIELCDLFTPVAGNYWVIVQNWDANLDPDEATLKTAVVGKNTLSSLYASGAGIVAAGASQTVRLSWDNVGATPGTELMGAVGIGTHRETPNNIGIIPVTFTKTGVDDPRTLVLMNHLARALTVKGGGMHNLTYIDIPPGADSLTVTASGEDGVQSDNLEIELYRMDFSSAFASEPFAAEPNISGNPIASATGSNGNGPSVTVSGNTLTQGRWYTVLKNNRDLNAFAEIKADITFTGEPITINAGLWAPAVRDISQGFDYGVSGNARAMIWYTYDEDGQPDWYLAAAAHQEGNIWTADLLRFTNDGLLQQESPVGHLSITTLAEDDNILSWVLYGKNGSERNVPSPSRACPEIDGAERSYTGLWGRAAEGVGGASGLINRNSQVFIHFIYDDEGNPRWLLSVPSPESPTAEEADLLQFTGACVVCDEKPVTFNAAGTFTRHIIDESNLTWTLDYTWLPPLSGSVNRTDDVQKLTLRMDCQ